MPPSLSSAQAYIPQWTGFSSALQWPANLCRLTTCVASTLVAVAVATHPLHATALGEDVLRDGLLRTCEPPRISCIVSQHDVPPSFVEPFEYDPTTITPRQALEAVRHAALQEKGADLIEETGKYLRFEFEMVGGVIDVAEFYFPPDDALVHFRAERKDTAFDFASNRARLRRIAVRSRLTRLYVQRNRVRVFGLFESPFDRFGPSVVDIDSIIENAPISSRPVR
ncbi:unnamed protein product [Agarophyton chilense]|eukprot:gb/GEZJ01006311.1/.p1 GENE.gb/GEZJ01006311.1/~~gb/GEZJ01006311.1/.p1  ORF type:complete len:225 (-),score=31.43 gb/GEZJ01006311.1/:384-1058(-)